MSRHRCDAAKHPRQRASAAENSSDNDDAPPRTKQPTWSIPIPCEVLSRLAAVLGKLPRQRASLSLDCMPSPSFGSEYDLVDSPPLIVPKRAAPAPAPCRSTPFVRPIMLTLPAPLIIPLPAPMYQHPVYLQARTPPPPPHAPHRV